MTIFVQLVPANRIRWGVSLALPLLDKGLKQQKVEDKYPLPWVEHMLLQGDGQLWLVWKNNKLTAAVMTMVKSYPSGKSYLEVFLLGGWKMASWAKQAYESVISYAKSIGCSTVAAGGRLGWNAMVKRYEKTREYRVDSLVAIELG